MLSKKKRKLNIAAARHKEEAAKRKATSKKKTIKQVHAGDKDLEVNKPEYPLKMGLRLQWTTMTQL